MRGDAHALARQQLHGNAARKHIGQREAAAVMAAAAQVVKAEAARRSGIIRMAGAGLIGQKAVVGAVGVGVFKKGGQRLAGGDAAHEAAYDARYIAFAAAGGNGAAGGAALKERAQRLLIQGKARGKPVQHHAHGLAVAFPKNLHAEHAPNAAAHFAIPPNWR